MAETPNAGLPLIDDSMTADVPRDFNGLAVAIDGAIGDLNEAIEHADIPDATLTTKGKVQLSSATNSTAEDRAATPKAVKDAMDAASGASESLSTHIAATNVHGATSTATASRLIIRDAAGRAKVTAPAANDDIALLSSITKAQAGLGSVDNYGTATQAEAEAGTVANKFMTPQRTKQAIDKFTGGVPFRVYAGKLEYYNGSVWKGVGGEMYKKPFGIIGTINNSSTSEFDILNVSGKAGVVKSIVANRSGVDPYTILRIYVDGILVNKTTATNSHIIVSSESAMSLGNSNGWGGIGVGGALTTVPTSGTPRLDFPIIEGGSGSGSAKAQVFGGGIYFENSIRITLEQVVSNAVVQMYSIMYATE